MVKLTPSLVTQKASQNKLCRKVDKKDKDLLLRSITHIKLHDSFIHEIGDISRCCNLTVLYLHNNCIERIDNLQHAKNLTHLYLQKNKIAKIENLGRLQKLRKLYLGHNCITVLEGLECLTSLEELHIEKQNLPPGELLYFDPRTLASLSACLKYLNTSGNKLTSISDLATLKMLHSLAVQDNCLDDISGIVETLKQWPFITSIDMRGNSVTKQKKYNENIIINSPPSLAYIDGKEVTETTRTFLKRLEWNKTNRPAAKKTSGLREATIANHFAGLAKQLPVGVRNSLSQAVLTSSGVLGNFPSDITATSAGNSFSKRSTSGGDTVEKIPRPFLHHARTGQSDRANPQEHPGNKQDGLQL